MPSESMTKKVMAKWHYTIKTNNKFNSKLIKFTKITIKIKANFSKISNFNAIKAKLIFTKSTASLENI